jgi:hypothetical protein
MLATLTGAAVAATGSPATDDEPISRGVPAQQSR